MKRPEEPSRVTSGRGRLGNILLFVLACGLLGAGVAAHTGTAEAGARPLHITLDRTAPAADSTVMGPTSEVRLFFSGAPLLRGASVRVTNSGRSLMRSTPPTHDPADLRQVFLKLDPALSAGAYVVQWRVIADDGHVMRGDFTFQVAGE